MKVVLKILADQDIDEFTQLIDVFEEVFEMKSFIKPDHNHLLRVLTNPGFLALIVKANNKVVGGRLPARPILFCEALSLYL